MTFPFLAGTILTADDLNSAFGITVPSTENTVGTTTSATYTATLTGGTTNSPVFVAPASGKVIVSLAAIIFQTGGNSFMSFEIRTGASIGGGTVFLAAADAHALTAGVGVLFRAGDSFTVPGLTPGSTYHARGMYKNDAAGTASFRDKHMIVNPTT